jgi:hypothetical protein
MSILKMPKDGFPYGKVFTSKKGMKDFEQKGYRAKRTCSGKPNKRYNPQTHQETTLKYFFGKDAPRGLLLYHLMGSGKTCTSIRICEEFLTRKKNEKNPRPMIYILSMGTHRPTWIKEFCKQCGKDFERFKENYIFITYTAPSIAEDFAKINLKNSLVVIDEVHNFIKSVKNQSKIAAVYDHIMKAGDNVRILGLSGTPIYNDYGEWPILGNMLKPNTFIPVLVPDNEGKIVFEPSLFKDQFVKLEDGRLALKPPNKESFLNALDGIISYFPGAGEGFYPKVTHIPVYVDMSVQQYQVFVEKMKTENRYRGMRGRRYLTLKMIASARTMTRGASNFLYPFEAYKPGKAPYSIKGDDVVFVKKEEEVQGGGVEQDIDIDIDIGDTDKDRDKLEEYEDILLPDLPLEEGGWITKKLFSSGQIDMYSPKFKALFQNILDNIGHKHVIYSFFKTHRGAILIQSLFRMCLGDRIRVELFTGDTSKSSREGLIDEFNSEENRYGQRIKILIISSAGGESIGLMECRFLHVLESDTRENLIKQVNARVVRFESHINLTPKQQNVTIYRYYSRFVGTFGGKQINIKGIDQTLQEEGQKKLDTIQSFQDILAYKSVTLYEGHKEYKEKLMRKINDDIVQGVNREKEIKEEAMVMAKKAEASRAEKAAVKNLDKDIKKAKDAFIKAHDKHRKIGEKYDDLLNEMKKNTKVNSKAFKKLKDAVWEASVKYTEIDRIYQSLYDELKSYDVNPEELINANPQKSASPLLDLRTDMINYFSERKDELKTTIRELKSMEVPQDSQDRLNDLIKYGKYLQKSYEDTIGKAKSAGDEYLRLSKLQLDESTLKWRVQISEFRNRLKRTQKGSD